MISKSHELHLGPTGIASLRYIATGELMHSHIGPWTEANLLYVEQGKLGERLNSPDLCPLVIYDLGLGIGANALAAIACLEEMPRPRKLEIISFENDLSGMQLALKEKESFPFLQKYEGLLRTLLSRGSFESKSGDLKWTLRNEDFLKAQLSGPAPELIFFDFYSPKSMPHLWTYECFKKLYASTEKRRQLGLSSVLLTYSAATAVRSALLLSGFHVGYGRSTETKNGTTVAATRLLEIERPLDQRWFDKFEASTKPLPRDWELFRFQEAKIKVLTSLGLACRAPLETKSNP